VAGALTSAAWDLGCVGPLRGQRPRLQQLIYRPLITLPTAASGEGAELGAVLGWPWA
jgi:hypothetical protein